MDRTITYHLLVALMLLVLYPKAESQWAPHRPLPPVSLPPLCASQLALANHACAVLPYKPVPPPSPPSPPSPSPPSPSPSPPAPDSPPSDDDDDDDGTESRHHHRHHHHGHSSKQTPAGAECCRWVKEVDDACVCGLLVHLPPFLTRPAHNYTVVVDDTCAVTFACGSRIVPL